MRIDDAIMRAAEQAIDRERSGMTCRCGAILGEACDAAEDATRAVEFVPEQHRETVIRLGGDGINSVAAWPYVERLLLCDECAAGPATDGPWVRLP